MDRLLNLFRRLTQTAAPRSTGRPRRARLALEGLEQRWAPSTVVMDPPNLTNATVSLLKSSPGADGCYREPMEYPA